MISRKAYQRLVDAGRILHRQFQLDPRDRERHPYWVNDMIRIYVRAVSMALSEAGVKMAKKSDKFKWNGYVNVEISATEAELAEAYIGDEKKVFMAIGKTVVDGYKLAVSFDQETETFRATATCFDKESPNFGYALGAFGSDWYTAIAAVLYKHYEISDEDWTSYAPKSGRSFG